MTLVDAERRALLRGKTLTRAGREQLARLRSPWGPSPPGLQGAGTQGECPDCARPCAAACDRELIQFYPDDHALAGMPFLVFDLQGCTLCGDCVNACPSGAKDSQCRHIGSAHLDTNRCMAWQNVICISCRSVCGEHAIILEARMRPIVAADKCNGCGACAAICPGDAITIVQAAV